MSPTLPSPPPRAPLPPEVLTPLAPGVGVVPVRSPTLPPATHTNCWVLGDDEVVVVDPASPWAEPRRALLQALGGRRVTAVLLTHHHTDHVSGAEHLARATGAPIWAHPQTAERVDLPVGRLLQDGDRLALGAHDWRVLHTPGHAPGHLCLLRPEDGEVVAGDLVAGEGTILLDPDDGDLEQYLASLSRLLLLEAERLLPAHGPPLAPAHLALHELIAHRHHRTAQVQGALSPGPRTPLQLAAVIYPELDSAWQAVAARQVVTHLRWLHALGQARPLDAADAGVHTAWTLDERERSTS